MSVDLVLLTNRAASDKVFYEGRETQLLCGLCNQISSSAHSSVVRGHVEFRALGSSTS